MTRAFSLFSFALKNLRRKLFRTTILIIAIGLLVSSIVFASSFIIRVNSSIRLTSERLGADVLVVPAGSRGAAEDVLLENKAKSFYMSRDIIDRVGKIKGVELITYQTYLVTVVGKCCDVPESIVVAFNQDTDFVIRPWLQEKLGRRLQRGEAIVGNESAINIRLGLTDVESVLFGNVFKMVGTLDKTGTGLDTAIFIDEENIEDILKKGKTDLKPGQISVAFIKVKPGYDPYNAARDIEDSILEVDAVTRKDIGKSVITALNDISRIFLISGILSAALSIFLVWSIFSAIANERAREVGLMRAIGAKERHIVGLFILEVAVVGIIGSIIGAGAGTALSVLLSKSFSILQSLSSDLGAIDRILIASASLIAGTGICIAGALSPIHRLKKMEPLTVIKGE